MRRMPSLAVLAFFPLVLAAPSHAATGADAGQAALTRTHERAVQTPCGKFVQDLGDRALRLVADKQLSPDQRTDAFGKILSNDFDLKTIGRFVIGRTWNDATAAQQSEYMELFKALVIHSYGSRMALYTGEGFQVTGTRPESDMDTTVLSQITHPDGSQPTAIDWRIRQKDGKFGVIDVVVEGVSLSVTQKQEYASVIQNTGGHIDGLLQTMREQLKAMPVSGVAK